MLRYLYFDLGHVLVHFSHERGCQQLAAKSGRSVAAIRQAIFDSPLQNDLESGRLSPHAFSLELNRHLQTELTEATITWALSDIFWTRREMVSLIAALSANGWPLGILSNTCLPHWQFLQQDRFAWLKTFFPHRILSYEEGVMKPHPQIYQRAIEAANVAANEIFFVDDRLENVEGALACGLRAVLFESAAQTRADLWKMGVRGHL